MRACANLSFMFHEAGSIVERYAAAANLGFKLVESDFPHQHSAQEVANALDNSGVQQVLLNCDQGDVTNGDMGFAAMPGEQDRFKSTIENSIVYAKALKCQKLHILSGRDLNSKDCQVETMIGNLKWASKRLKQENISALIEPINPESKPGYFLNNYDTAIEVIDRVNEDNLTLQLDIFHLQKICGNITKNIKKLLPYTGHIQVAQPPLRHEPSYDGELNYEYIFELLQQLGYSGHIGCEYTPSHNTLQWITRYGLTY